MHWNIKKNEFDEDKWNIFSKDPNGIPKDE